METFPLPFSFFTNTLSSPFRWPTALALCYRCACFGPALFLWMKGTWRWSDGLWKGEGRRWLRGKADTFLSRIMLLPQLERKKWPYSLAALHIQDGCIFFFEGDGNGGCQKKKKNVASFKMWWAPWLLTVSRGETDIWWIYMIAWYFRQWLLT